MTALSMKTIRKEMLADMLTPTAIYLLFRDVCEGSALLETSGEDTQGKGVSIICLDRMATFSVQGGTVTETVLGDRQQYEASNIASELDRFIETLKPKHSDSKDSDDFNGVYGFMGFDSVHYFDTFSFDSNSDTRTPDIYYALYRFVLVYNHHTHILSITENCPLHEPSQMERITDKLNMTGPEHTFFKTEGVMSSSLTDEQFLELSRTAQQHCRRGDVFQLVLSRSYKINYLGDEFNVYRQLRSLNPSPYMFYFDFDEFTLFGASPESLVRIENDSAVVNPIAGTRKKTGVACNDRAMAEELRNDPKENAEHVMLVDLARNDLSKNALAVKVDTYAQLHHYSHVMHLVSNVSGTLPPNQNRVEILADVFPAGTLSGAPKHKAIELINKYEPHKRGFYGGCIGYFDFNGGVNTAIIIRSFLAQENILTMQAGAGIVEQSVPEQELLEIKNKLNALFQAIEQAIHSHHILAQ
jgi:anthranilate synthase component 1